MAKKKISISNTIDTNNLKFYFGIPHAHCAFSTGIGTPIEAFDYARHNGLDFLILTDHNNYLSKSVRIRGEEFTKWNASQYLSSRCNKKHENFLSVIGFESKTNLLGDINVVNPGIFFTGSVNNIQLLVLWMLNNPNAFISINHPHSSIEHLEFNPVLNKIITSIEVGNGSLPNKYQRYEKYYYKLLDKGWKLSAINGQDNHRLNFGDTENLTCVVANNLTIPSLIQAFREHHTYSTESRSLVMYFMINDLFMGSSIDSQSKELNFLIFAKDTNNKIIEIQILSNNGIIIKKISNLNLNRVRYIYKHEPENNERWYVIKVILENSKIAISSPIFRE
ncbi:histidinol phosphatase [Clostridium butyricum]|uniref:histidinol phosphatase n=1 Tax=Clostridium butyricum TaxID=1492 RepID=UPI0022E08A5F|nr:histidinol phosphatase [Clostridium butyricum]